MTELEKIVCLLADIDSNDLTEEIVLIECFGGVCGHLGYSLGKSIYNQLIKKDLINIKNNKLKKIGELNEIHFHK